MRFFILYYKQLIKLNPIKRLNKILKEVENYEEV